MDRLTPIVPDKTNYTGRGWEDCGFWCNRQDVRLLNKRFFTALLRSREPIIKRYLQIEKIKQEKKVMKEKQENKSRIIGLRLSPKEYAQIQKKCQKSTRYKLSEYARRMLLSEPLKVYYRNQSLDELMTEMMVLRKELNTVGNNFNQAVKKLHTLSQIPEFSGWLLTWEQDRQNLLQKVEEIKVRMAKIEDIWLQ